MQIGKRQIRAGCEPFIIAEIGVNHDGSVERASELVSAAKKCGANAVKLQYFAADRLLSRGSRLAAYQQVCGAKDPHELLRTLELSSEDIGTVADAAHSVGLACIVTIFSCEDIKDLSSIEWDAYKTASPDIINRPLLTALAAAGLPLIVSTGTATECEVARASAWLAGHEAAFLQCVSAYPTPEEFASLGAIRSIAQLVRRPVGYSDHTMSIDTGALAVAAGACILEKHLTHDPSANGPDHAASLDPNGFSRYVMLARRAHTMMGASNKQPLAIENDVRVVSRQSLVAIRRMPKGHVIGRSDLTIKRPGTGIQPWRLDEILGQCTTRDVEPDTPLNETDVTAVDSVPMRAATDTSSRFEASSSSTFAEREAAA